MKRKICIAGLFLLSLTMVSCSKSNQEKTEESTVNSSEKKEVSIFKGTVSELPVIDDSVVNITFNDIEAINDPDEIVDNLNANGVVLLAPFDVFKKSLEPEDVAIGNELIFELKVPAAMTFSIPPQISGNSIEAIEKSK